MHRRESSREDGQGDEIVHSMSEHGQSDAKIDGLHEQIVVRGLEIESLPKNSRGSGTPTI
jgi:hypothetical protein